MNATNYSGRVILIRDDTGDLFKLSVNQLNLLYFDITAYKHNASHLADS